MEQEINRIKGWYVKRVSLYEELLSCIKRERDNLINQDIKGIWNSLEEKKEILESIEEVNKIYSGSPEKNPVFHDIPKNDRNNINNLSRQLKGLKEEITVRVKENVLFINDTLSFINELFSILGKSGNSEITYGPNKKSRGEAATLIYRNEV